MRPENTGIDRRAVTAGLASAVLTGSSRAMGAVPPIRIGYVPVIGASALFALEGAGWAKDAGLSLALTRFDSGPAAIQALASGSLDMLAIGVAPVAVAYSKGLPVRVVSAAALGGSYFMARPPLAAALAGAKDRASAFASLRAKLGRPVKLATLPPGAVPAVALNYWLFKTGGVARADVDILALGIDGVQQAMLSRSVDGATVLEPSASIVRARDASVVEIAPATSMLPNIPGVVIAATTRFESAQPKALQTIVGLVRRATNLIRSHPDQVAPHVAAILGGGLVPASIMLQALKSPAIKFVTDPEEIAAPTKNMLAYEVQLGDFATAPKIEGLFDSSWWKKAAPPK